MEYIKIDKSSIVKYLVEFDKSAIIVLRNRIIDNCSDITHVVKDRDEKDYFYYSKLKNIRNLKSIKTGETVKYEYDFEDEVVDLYHTEYDYLQIPQLAVSIDRLLNGDSSAIESIFNPIKPAQNNRKEEIIKTQQYLLDKCRRETGNAARYLITLKELQDEYTKIVKHDELNKNQVSESSFYSKVQDLITLNMIDALSFDEYNKVCKFFGHDLIEKANTKKQV